VASASGASGASLPPLPLPLFVHARLARLLLAGIDPAGSAVAEPELFFRLRAALRDAGQLLDLSQAVDEATWEQLRPGAIVELRGELRRNPVQDLLDTVAHLSPHAGALADLTATPRPANVAAPGRAAAAEAPVSDQVAMAVFRLALADVNDPPTQDVLFRLSSGDVVCVATLPRDLEGMAIDDLVGIELRMLAKVVRLVGPDESLSLLRRSRLGPRAADLLRAGFAQTGADSPFPLEMPELDVPGPTLQLLPIALFV
jgi:hypothetical protein